MSQLIAGLSGANGAASNAGSYYQNAADNIFNTAGSPEAQKFSQIYQAALQPGFQQSQQGLLGTLASQGITTSGAGKADLSNLFSNQSAQFAQGVAPMYQEAEQQYGNVLSQQPGAELGAYNQANNQFIQGVGSLGSLAAEIYGGGFGGGIPGGTGSDGNFYSPNQAASTQNTTTSSPYGN